VTRTRLAPLPHSSWSDEERAALAGAFGSAAADQFASGERETPNVLGTLLHHPALAGPFLSYNNVLLRKPTLDARLRELIVLRVAWRTRAPYEWAQHARLATGLGITGDEIDAIALGAEADCWSALEANALAATDQCIDGYRVDDDTWDRLAKELDERQLVELLFVVGTYTALAMAFNSFGLELEPELHEFAASFPAIEE
jgi:alkylhydroperoxidase family enzyme